MFQKCFEGQESSFSKKFWGPLGYVLASSLVSKKGWKNMKNQLFGRKKSSNQSDAESPPDHVPLVRKFISPQNDSFMHFSIFSKNCFLTVPPEFFFKLLSTIMVIG